MEELPHEMLFDIFSRLPVKSLRRLSCTSTSLDNIIEDPYLATSHLTRAYANEPGEILAIECITKDSDYSILLHVLRKDVGERVLKTSLLAEFKNKYGEFCFKGCCNGLLCFSTSTDCDDSSISISRVIVLNPITKETLLLPQPQPSKIDFMMSYGLGHDPSTNTYKVIHTYFTKINKTCGFDMKDYRVEIHTLGTNSWREINEKPTYLLWGKPVFAHGALHWKPYDYLFCKKKVMLVSFDMANEVFYETSHPRLQYYQVVDIGGCLSVVDLSSKKQIEIWLSKDWCINGKKEEWVKEYTINIEALYPYESHSQCVIVVGMWENGEILFKFWGRLISYDPKTQGLRDFPVQNYSEEVYGYKGSLVSLSSFM